MALEEMPGYVQTHASQSTVAWWNIARGFIFGVYTVCSLSSLQYKSQSHSKVTFGILASGEKS